MRYTWEIGVIGTIGAILGVLGNQTSVAVGCALVAGLAAFLDVYWYVDWPR